VHAILDCVNTLFTGMQSGSIYALIALGISLTFRASGIFNFTQATFVMTGAIVGVICWQSLGWPLVLALAAGAVTAGATGVFVERIVVRPVMGQMNPQWIVSTFGALIAGSSLFTLLLLNTGSKQDIRGFPDLWGEHTSRYGPFIISLTRLLPVILLIIAVTGLTWWQRRTRYGQALSAIANDKEAAAIRGIPVHRVAMIAFGVAGLLGGLTGMVAAPLTQVSTYGALDLAVKGFVANAIGGMQSTTGAIVGGLTLGVLEKFVTTYLDGSLQMTAIVGAFLIILAVRPEGLISTQTRSV
jgi:branched-chain amino acid transport system permease protein